MIARSYRSGSGLADAKALDSLVDYNRAGNVRLDSDRIVLVESNLSGPVVGALIWRPLGFIHELVLAKDSMARRTAASALISFAMGEARARQYDLKSSLFLIDEHNEPMLRFVREIGATPQPGVAFTFNF